MDSKFTGIRNAINKKCEEMLAVYTVKADGIFQNELGRLKA